MTCRSDGKWIRIFILFLGRRGRRYVGKGGQLVPESAAVLPKVHLIYVMHVQDVALADW